MDMENIRWRIERFQLGHLLADGDEVRDRSKAEHHPPDGFHELLNEEFHSPPDGNHFFAVSKDNRRFS